MLENIIKASCKSILFASVDSLLITIKSFNLSSFILKRKKLLTLFKDEKTLSLEAVVQGNVRIIESTLRVSENAEGSFDNELVIVVISISFFFLIIFLLIGTQKEFSLYLF